MGLIRQFEWFLLNGRSEGKLNDSPRFLIVTKTRISDHDGASLALRNWLHRAFPTHVAQIYSGGIEVGGSPFPAYRLGAADREFGRLFSMLKQQAQHADAVHERAATADTGAAPSGRLSALIRGLGKLVLSMGLWELVFKPKLSPELRKFVQDFAPDVILAQGFDLGFTWLPIRIHEQFGVPITTIIVDDWEPHLYEGAPRIFGMRGIARRAFVHLLRKSRRCYCITPLMAQEYEQRYGVTFEVLMQVDHRPLLNEGQAKPLDPRRFVVAYSGSLGLKRWEGLHDLAEALSSLAEQGLSGELHVYAPSLPAEAAVLQRHRRIKLFPHLPDEDVLSVLSEADVVFLPESFDRGIRRYIRLSLSTKAHLYMMTGSIPLVYGPPEVATVRYAAEEGWGVVVAERGVRSLADAVRSVIDSRELRDRVVVAAAAAFRRNHSPASHSLSSLLPSVESP